MYVMFNYIRLPWEGRGLALAGGSWCDRPSPRRRLVAAGTWIDGLPDEHAAGPVCASSSASPTARSAESARLAPLEDHGVFVAVALAPVRRLFQQVRERRPGLDADQIDLAEFSFPAGFAVANREVLPDVLLA